MDDVARMIGPDKITSVHRAARELVTTAPPSVRPDVEQLATQLGVGR